MQANGGPVTACQLPHHERHPEAAAWETLPAHIAQNRTYPHPTKASTGTASDELEHILYSMSYLHRTDMLKAASSISSCSRDKKKTRVPAYFASCAGYSTYSMIWELESGDSKPEAKANQIRNGRGTAGRADGSTTVVVAIFILAESNPCFPHLPICLSIYPRIYPLTSEEIQQCLSMQTRRLFRPRALPLSLCLRGTFA